MKQSNPGCTPDLSTSQHLPSALPRSGLPSEGSSISPSCPEEGIPATPVISVNEPMLATFALAAYNQEKFIREAVEGAFAQTYSPLQIILSDDCSPDSTFEVMKAMARDYHGPHEILLNRNSKNLGIGDHINKLFELTKGGVLIGAAGDDISLPNRTMETMRVFHEHPDTTSVVTGAQVFGFYSNYMEPYVIDRKQNLVEICWTLGPGLGCSTAYRTNVMTVFGPLHADVVCEDVPLLFRSLVLGRHRCIPMPLVLYRSHDDSLTKGKDMMKNRLKHNTGLNQIILDLRVVCGHNMPLFWFCSLLVRLHTLHTVELDKLNTKNKNNSLLLSTISLLIYSGRICRLLHPSDWIKRKAAFFKASRDKCEEH